MVNAGLTDWRYASNNTLSITDSHSQGWIKFVATRNTPVHQSNHNTISTCPVCEYQGRMGEGQSFVGEKSYGCKNCGARWRVINQKTNDIKRLISKPTNNPKQWLFWRFATITFGLVFVALLYFTNPSTFFSAQNTPQIIIPKPLSIGNIKVVNLVKANGHILVISGKVRNNSLHRLKIPPLFMYSGHKGSSGYYDWTYHPALQYLAPGASFMFQTSIRKPAGGANLVKLKFAGI